MRDGQACSGSGGDGDLREGAVVVVYGDNDEKLAIGHLTEGVGVSEGDAVSCVWKFVPDVSADSEYYLVEVTDRGRHRYDTSEIHGRVDVYVKAR